MPLLTVQYKKDQTIPDLICQPASGTGLCHLSPRLLQLPLDWSSSLCNKTLTNGPERGCASGVQPTQKGACHATFCQPALATSVCSNSTQSSDPCLQSQSRFCSGLLKGYVKAIYSYQGVAFLEYQPFSLALYSHKAIPFQRVFCHCFSMVE